MAYIYLDESGDLGFKKTSSRWFIFTIALVTKPRSLERVVKRVWDPLKKKHRRLGELHAYHANDATKRRMLQLLDATVDLQVLCVALDKHRVYLDLQNQKNYLYNYTASFLLDRLHLKHALDPSETIHLIVDRKDTKKRLKENFINYLIGAMKKRSNTPLKVVLHTSHESKSLQAVDFISWAIFRKYERGDFKYYDMIQSKITDECLVFPSEKESPSL